MFNHKENALKRLSTYIILFNTKKLRKKIFMRNLIKIYTMTHKYETFFQNFLAGEHAP